MNDDDDQQINRPIRTPAFYVIFLSGSTRQRLSCPTKPLYATDSIYAHFSLSTAQDVYDKVSTHADQTQLTAPRSEYDRGVNTFSPEVSSSTVRHLSVTDASCRVDYSKVRYKRRGTTSREC